MQTLRNCCIKNMLARERTHVRLLKKMLFCFAHYTFFTTFATAIYSNC